MEFELKSMACRPLPAGTAAMDAESVQGHLAAVPGWAADRDRKSLSREYSGFASYKAGLAFLNTAAHLADEENHHPDLQLGYKRVRVSWSTHSVGGLSLNDFICAAKLDALAGAEA